MRARVAPLLLLALAALLVGPASAQDKALFSQAASASLEQQFGRRDVSWLLLDSTGRIISQHWNDPNRPIAPGSLFKPFIALAWGEQFGAQFPHAVCTGTRGRCWYPAGHGRLGFEEALAQSCNAYFLSLARDVDRDRADGLLARLGLAGPPREAMPETLIGLDNRWQESPLTLARAYLALFRDSPQPVRDRIVAGMQAAAMRGTARAVDAALGTRAALAKTGTAECSHRPRGAADGFTVVLYPATQPRLILLVRMHGATGAQTSAQAGAMLRSIGMGDP